MTRWDPRRVAIGFAERSKLTRKIVILLDLETFEWVRHRAIKQEVSFATVARELIEWGMMDAEGVDRSTVAERERCAKIAAKWDAPWIVEEIMGEAS